MRIYLKYNYEIEKYMNPAIQQTNQHINKPEIIAKLTEHVLFNIFILFTSHALSTNSIVDIDIDIAMVLVSICMGYSLH